MTVKKLLPAAMVNIGIFTLVFIINEGQSLNVVLDKLSALRLPHQYSPTEFRLNNYDATQIAFDSERAMMYVCGMFI